MFLCLQIRRRGSYRSEMYVFDELGRQSATLRRQDVHSGVQNDQIGHQ